MTVGSAYLAKAQRLRKLMIGNPDPTVVMAGIKGIVDERIGELTDSHEQRTDGAAEPGGTASGPEPESG